MRFCGLGANGNADWAPGAAEAGHVVGNAVFEDCPDAHEYSSIAQAGEGAYDLGHSDADNYATVAPSFAGEGDYDLDHPDADNYESYGSKAVQGIASGDYDL